MMLRKMKLNRIFTIGYSLTLLLSFTACNNDDDDPSSEPEVQPEPEIMENKTTGFIVEGGVDGGTRVAKYIEELPIGGSLDLSVDSQSYGTFLIRSLHDNAIFTQRTDGSPGFAKHVVNADGKITEVGVIVAPNADGKIKVKDSERGVFYDVGSLSVFNPTTFEVTGSIDMSAAFVPNNINYRYAQFGFRGDIVYGAILPNDGETSGFTSLVIHQADLSTNTFVGNTQRDSDENRPSTINPLFVENVNTAVTNDLYIADAGNFEASGIAGRINKIPVGSNEIDPDYVFEPSRVLNPSPLNLLPSISSFYNLGNGKAIAVVNKELPEEAVTILTAAGFNLANVSPEDFLKIRTLLFIESTAVWCMLDLQALTVTPIDGLPATGPFSGSQTFEYDGDIYIYVNNLSGTGYYKLDPDTMEVSKAFDLEGASGISVFNLEDNY